MKRNAMIFYRKIANNGILWVFNVLPFWPPLIIMQQKKKILKHAPKVCIYGTFYWSQEFNKNGLNLNHCALNQIGRGGIVYFGLCTFFRIFIHSNCVNLWIEWTMEFSIAKSILRAGWEMKFPFTKLFFFCLRCLESF